MSDGVASLLFRYVEEQTGIGRNAIRGPGQDRASVNARRIFSALARAEGASYPAIGRLLWRDHTTILALLHGRKHGPRVPYGYRKAAP